MGAAGRRSCLRSRKTSWPICWPAPRETGPPGVPHTLPSVAYDSWRAAFYDRTGADREDRKAFWRVTKELLAAKAVAKAGGQVWLTKPK